MNDRIQRIIKEEGYSSTSFANEIGVQPSRISHIISGRNKASIDFIIKILHRFPGISTDWLIMGKGEMYKDEIKNNDKIYSNTSQTDLFNQKESPEEINKADKYDEKENIGNYDDNKVFDKEDIHPESMVKSDISDKNKKVEKIVVFYSDKTFSAYFPE